MPATAPDVPVELPAMLFPSDEMLLPGCTQVLHLYEARFLALLDEVTTTTGGLFAHVTFLPSDQDDGGLRVNQARGRSNSHISRSHSFSHTYSFIHCIHTRPCSSRLSTHDASSLLDVKAIWDRGKHVLHVLFNWW